MAGRFRERLEYREWRKTVLATFGRKCILCGFDSNLHAHHVWPVATYPEKALDPMNGVPLCGNCHTQVNGNEEAHVPQLLAAQRKRLEEMRPERLDPLLQLMEAVKELDFNEPLAAGSTDFLAKMPYLSSLGVSDCDEATLALIAKNAPRLQELSLTGDDISDGDMTHFAGLKYLRKLTLYLPNLTDNGLDDLAGLSHLETLEVDFSRVAGYGLGYIGELRALREISLTFTSACDESLGGLSDLPLLARLDGLNLSNTKVTEEGLEAAILGGLLNLKQLVISSTQVTALPPSLFMMKRLTEFGAHGLGLTDDDIGSIHTLPFLKWLVLGGNPITDDTANRLRQLRYLESVHLDDTYVTEEGVRSLMDLPRLARLTLPSLPEKFVEEMRQTYPHVQVLGHF